MTLYRFLKRSSLSYVLTVAAAGRRAMCALCPGLAACTYGDPLTVIRTWSMKKAKRPYDKAGQGHAAGEGECRAWQEGAGAPVTQGAHRGGGKGWKSR